MATKGKITEPHMEVPQEQLDRIERKLDDLLAYFHVGDQPRMGKAEIKDFVAAILLKRERKRRNKMRKEKRGPDGKVTK